MLFCQSQKKEDLSGSWGQSLISSLINFSEKMV
jgi:hypothetical protein